MNPTISSSIADLLGEAILVDPPHGTARLTRTQYHELMRLTGGLVILRGSQWVIEARCISRQHLQLSLRKEGM